MLIVGIIIVVVIVLYVADAMRRNDTRNVWENYPDDDNN